MQDNTKTSIRLIVANVECQLWDEAQLDSQIDTPADGWSLNLFNPAIGSLPSQVRGGAPVRIYYGDELVLKGIVDQVSETATRTGRVLSLSGRDLAGQLIDCSVPLFSAQNISLEELLGRFVLNGNLGSIIHNVIVKDAAWLNNKVAVEPGESLWDAIAKAAAVTGQFMWFEPDGTIKIGDPFADAYVVQTPLQLMYDGANNNVLSLEYSEDVTGVFSDISLISQDDDATPLEAQTTTTTPYSFKRLKIISLADIKTQAEAQAALNKIKHDNDLEAYNLSATVAGWQIDNKVWRSGFEVSVQTDVLPRANAKWVVMGRTLNLSRSSGKTTTLKLKRKGDWAQPLIYKEQTKAKKKKASRQDTSLGLGDAERGIYDGDSQ